MQRVEELWDQIKTLHPVEREDLLFLLLTQGEPPFRWPFWLSHQEHPAIVATPAVCGGAARLIRTRIPVWTLERMRQLGLSEGDILRSYPTLRAADLVQAWSYVAHHRQEIEQAIAENEAE